MNVAGHDSNFTYTRTNDTGAVRTNQACRFVRQKLFYLHHVERGDAFGNAHDYRNACIGSFHDSVRRERRRHIDYGSVGSCFLDCVGNGVEDRNAFVCRTALTRSYTTNDVGAVLDHLFCMKRTFPAGNSLHDEARRLINQYAQLRGSLSVKLIMKMSAKYSIAEVLINTGKAEPGAERSGATESNLNITQHLRRFCLCSNRTRSLRCRFAPGSAFLTSRLTQNAVRVRALQPAS